MKLIKHLQEATRATPEGGPRTYVPPTGGEIAEANYHHFVFGQRGSGKSSLLRHLQAMTTEHGRASVWIDQEIFSNLHYPDVLVSVVFALMHGVMRTLEDRVQAAADSRTWRQKVFRQKRPSSEQQKLLLELRSTVSELEKLKFAPLDRKIEWVVVDERSATRKVSAGLKVELVSIGFDGDRSTKLSATATEVIEGSKEQFLERALTIFRDLLTRVCSGFGGGFVFVDDLYQLRRSDQPLVLGYMHRLVKDTQGYG